MPSARTRWISLRKKWWLLSLFIALFISVPLIFILIGVFEKTTEGWHHIAANLLPTYIENTIILVLSVGSLAFIIGTGCAWLVSRYNFPGRNFLASALYLPLAIPAYILAFTYSGIFDFTGVYQTTMRGLFSAEQASSMYFNIMQMKWLVVLLALALYPYVYATTRVVFQLQSAAYFEVAQSHGISGFKLFGRVALPLARTAIAGGLFLVLMETLNDYGAMKYFGIPTFTTGIFRAWFSLGDLPAAIKLASLLVLTVIILLTAEKLIVGKARYHSESQPRPMPRQNLSGPAAGLALAACALPFVLGFGMPVLQLLAWAFRSAASVINPDFIWMVVHSLSIALGSSVLVVVLAVVLIYSSRINKMRKNGLFRTISLSGYAVPGAIIAVGVLVPATQLDRWLNSTLGTTGLLLTGSLTLLVFAYVVRFFAVGHNPIDAGFSKNPESFEDTAIAAGRSELAPLLKVHLPTLRPALLAAFILTFVDVMKELPLTLILRPANFNTLATKAFELANDEMVHKAASPAIILILLSVIPVLLLGKKNQM